MKYKFTFLCILFFWSSLAFAQQNLNLNKAFTHAVKQTKVMLREIADTSRNNPPIVVVPRTLTPKGSLRLVASKDWTSGFFPGNLWFLYEHTQDPFWLNQAQAFTAKLKAEQYDKSTHDLGFKIYCSYGTGYRITQDTAYRAVIIQAAKSLSTRFNPKAGIIRSWDHSTHRWKHPVIIDNMMNLELLFNATRLTGDSSYYKIAKSHADTTLKNHFRADYSSWHVVDYDSLTGKVLKKTTAQGYSNSSAWARGQAWGLYGYTMCYRETKNPAYLEHAEKIAAYILSHPNLPADGVPYWDFNAPLIPNEPRDASAASVIASALYELSTYSSQKTTFKAAADKILKSLATDYDSPVGENRGFVLVHSTGNKPGNTEVDVPLVYADYYYLEALIRRKQLNTPPQITPVKNKAVTVGKALRFTVAATDFNSNQIQTFSLVNAPKGVKINLKTGTLTWTPTSTQKGVHTFLVRVTDNGSPILYSEQPITVKVNPIKQLSLQISIVGKGTVTRDPMQNTYAEGTKVKLIATPATGYQFVGWSGDITATTSTISITMNKNKQVNAEFALIPPHVLKLDLVNADTDKTISTLQNNAIIDLAKLSTQNITIEARINTASTKSVVFELSGKLVRKQIETTRPLVLFGDVNGDKNAWTPETGQYTLKVTPFSERNGLGTTGESVSIKFTVINSQTNNPKRQAIAENIITDTHINIVAYPNPTNNGQFTVQLPANFKGKLNYTVHSLIGAKLAAGQFNLIEAQNVLNFNLSREMSATGIYYLHVESANAKGVIKIVRQ